MNGTPEPNPYPRRKWIEYGAVPVAILFWIAVYLSGPWLQQLCQPPRCAWNLKQLCYACQIYSNCANERFPTELGGVYWGYITDTSIFICPRSHAPVTECRVAAPGAITDANVSFCYVSGLLSSDPPGYVAAFDEEWNHGGGGVYVVRVGGQVSWQKDMAQLHERLAEQAAELAAKGRTMKVIRPSWSTWPAEPPWLEARRRYWWIAGGSCAAALLLAAAVALVMLRRRRGRNAAPDA